MVQIFSKFADELNSRLNLEYVFYRWRRENSEITHYIQDRNIQRERPSFSIVVPTYSIDLSYVKDFVASLHKQSYRDWELCVCDDGDPNTSVTEYFRELEKNSPDRFRFTRHSENQGIGNATKTALKLARNDFVVLADADDLLHARALELMAAVIAEDDAIDFLYSNHDYMTEWGLRLHPVIKPGWSPELLLHVNYINHLKAIRTSLLREIIDVSFEPEFNGAQDWSLCFQVMQTARKVKHIPFVLYHWRARPGSMANDFFAKPWAIAAQLKLRTKFFTELEERVEFHPTENRVVFKTSPSVDGIDLRDKNLKSKSTLREYVQTLLRQVENLGAEYIYFFSNSQFGPDEAGKVAAYCSLPNTGGMWPFNGINSRLAFSPIYENSEDCVFLPILNYRLSCSNFSGNILAGPLNGMTFKRSRFMKVAQATLNSDLDFQFEGRIEDLCGIIFSLTALRLGLRNGSVNAAFLDYKPEPVRLPAKVAGVMDPYI
jgi:glycosyltransferase involved in cell wall biosynthesis